MASLFSTCLFAVKDGRDYKMAQLHKVPTKKSAFDSDYKINAQKNDKKVDELVFLYVDEELKLISL